MIQRFDNIAVDLPIPESPNPAAAAAVQELMGGKFGEMSTLLNYTFQSFNFRGKAKYRPFYDLICNIAAEEFSHIEAVAAAINLLLSGSTMRADRNKPAGKNAGLRCRQGEEPHHDGSKRPCAPSRCIVGPLCLSFHRFGANSSAFRFNG